MKRLFSLIAASLVVTISASGQSQSLNMTKLGQLSYNKPINDVWGWTDTATSKEYALVGVQDGVSVVEVTDPANPQEVLFVPGASSVWRDLKTYGDYAYVIHDRYSGTSSGIEIIDLSTLGNTFPTTYNRFPTVNINGNPQTFDQAHNIFIDENGILYVFGANVGVGGVLMFDVAQNPTNPPLVGLENVYYYHDGVVQGDTLWGAAINKGFFTVVDVSSKSNPQMLASQGTPNSFTHNIWMSDDNQRVFTTDERTNAYVASYDVSDLSNITELDRIQSSLSSQVIPHNTHFFNDFLITSYYTSGVQIVDVAKPGSMVEVGHFDTSPASGDGFSGNWGAYPYLPSGNILVTDRGEGLFTFSSTYPRGCYLEVKVEDAVSGQPIPNAQVATLGGGISGNTDFQGLFQDAQEKPGNFDLVTRAPGYKNDTLNLIFIRDTTLNLTVALGAEDVSLAEHGAWKNTALYPNPTSGKVVLEDLPAGLKEAQYLLTDLMGKTVRQGTIEIRQQKARVLLDAPAGHYILQLRSTQYGPARLRLQLR